jgi:hypothetical protein
MVTLRSVPVLGPVFGAQLDWKELPTIGSYGRMLDPSQTTGREKSNRVRVLIWEGVVDLISPHDPLRYPDGSTDTFNFLRPLIGYGPESMYVAYNKFYPAELATVEARNASPDRSHNETFDALVITGLAGFLAWQALYVSVFYYGFKYLGVVGSKRDRNVLIGAWGRWGVNWRSPYPDNNRSNLSRSGCSNRNNRWPCCVSFLLCIVYIGQRWRAKPD